MTRKLFERIAGLSGVTVLLLCLPAVILSQPQAAPQQGTAGDMQFVPIPPGEFMMGCSAEDTTCADDEKPAHRVRITKQIEMGKYLVTQAQWEAIMGSNPSHFKGADHPVERTNWNDMQEFLKRLNARQDGYRYRLPTEAEWEYAERAGTTGIYAGPLDEVAWYSKNSGGQTHPVGQKKPNAWGLYDMEGNVQEWILDTYIDGFNSYYTPAAISGGVDIDPVTPTTTGSLHVMRGASWGNDARLARSSSRNRTVTGDVGNFRGFRCVREKIR